MPDDQVSLCGWRYTDLEVTASCLPTIRNCQGLRTIHALVCNAGSIPGRPKCGRVLVLKAYDHRFAAEFREEKKASPWSVEIEQQYRQFLLSRDGEEFIARLRDGGYGISDMKEIQKDAARLEAYLDHRLGTMFDAEVETYNTLSELQGKCIPRLYSTVRVLDANQSPTIPGILMQYLDGFSLMDIAVYAPREHWQFIGEDATEFVHCLNSKNVLNEGVSRRNVCKDEKFRVFMIRHPGTLYSWDQDWDFCPIDPSTGSGLF